MADLASLVIEIDSTQAKGAAGDLDKLTAAGKRTEAEMGAVGRSTATAAQQAAEMAREAQSTANAAVRSAVGLRGMGNATQKTAFHMQNLGFQIQDIGVQLASGGNPLQILAQQGTQIYGIFQQAGDSAGALAYRVGFLIGRLLPFAAAVGAGYAALKLFQDQLNDRAPADEFVKSLGLTDKELKKLGDTSVTVGDMFAGLWKVIADRTGVDESIASFKAYMLQAFTEALAGAGRAMAGIYGEVVGTYRAIGKVWDDLPAMFGAAFARAANAAAEKLEGFINGAIGAMNNLARQANDLLGTNLFGTIGNVSLPRMEADFSKSFGSVRGIIRGEIASATAEAQTYINGFVGAVGQAAIQARNARLRAAADDIIADRTNKAAKAHKDRAKAADEEAKALARLLKLHEQLARESMLVSKDLLGADAPGEMKIGRPDKLLPDVKFIETPFDQWAKTVPQTAADINFALQSIQVQGFEGLASAITGVITGTQSLKDAFSNLARSIIAEIIQMTVRMLIFRAVSSIFGGNFSAGVGAANYTPTGVVGPRATGGPVAAGKPYLVGERGPEVFVPRGNGAIVPNNSLGGGGNQKVTVELVGFTDQFKMNVRQEAAGVVRDTAPVIVAAAQQRTTRTLSRRPIS